jgi:hypothetical protein
MVAWKKAQMERAREIARTAMNLDQLAHEIRQARPLHLLQPATRPAPRKHRSPRLRRPLAAARQARDTPATVVLRVRHTRRPHVDHINPNKRTGITLDDVQVLCRRCNSSKGRRPFFSPHPDDPHANPAFISGSSAENR